ncbi:MAG: ABC transporter substrate-binding protein, partial [Thaumarchaeota archaeon]|nr:ABC transporter substrate-binding protein [Nitrososphaerota archaeon]
TPAQIAANEYLDPGHVQNIVIQLKTDDTARYIDLSTGAAQVATILDTNWPKILAAPNTYGYASVPAKSMLINGVAMNTLRYPTNITAVRNAIYDVINYSQINHVAYGGSLHPWVGPEYPVWTQYYNLGNATPWPTDVTKAKQIILSACAANSNACPAKFPILDFRIQTGCTFCYNTATVIVANLAAINISATIEVTPISQYACVPNGVAGPCSFTAGVQNSATEAQLAWLGAFTFAPGADTPADPWLGWVNGVTPANNWALYSNPVVQKCDTDFVAGVSNATLLADCTAAQAQVNLDTPYIWIGSLGLVDASGSPAYNKNIIANGLLDSVYTGQSDTFILNTITFTNGQ